MKRPGAAIATRVVAFIIIAVGLLAIANATRGCGEAAKSGGRDAGPPLNR